MHRRVFTCATLGATGTCGTVHRADSAVFVVLRRGSLQVYGQCRRDLLTAAGVRQVVRGDVLLHARPGANARSDVVWFVLGREIYQGRLTVGTGAHRVVMVGLGHRPVWHLSIFVASFAAGTGSAGTATATTSASTAGTSVDSLHLPGSIQNQLDTVRALIVDTTPANGLRKVVDHGPRHPRQIAQITVLAFRLNRHFDPRSNSPPKMVNSNIHSLFPCTNPHCDDPEPTLTSKYSCYPCRTPLITPFQQSNHHVMQPLIHFHALRLLFISLNRSTPSLSLTELSMFVPARAITQIWPQ